MGLSALLLISLVACARAPEAPPTSAAPPTAAAKPATSAPAAPTTAPTTAAAKPTTATAAATAAPTTAAAAKGGEIVVGKDQEAPGLDPAKNPAQGAI